MRQGNRIVAAAAVCVLAAACGESASDDDTMGTGYRYADEVVQLDESWTIAAGETVRVGPGTTFEAAAGVAIRVEGSLIVEGSADC